MDVAFKDFSLGTGRLPIIDYPTPTQPRDQRDWGPFCFWLAMLSLSLPALFLFATPGMLPDILLAGIYFGAAALGMACGILAVIRSSPHITLTVVGLTLNSLIVVLGGVLLLRSKDFPRSTDTGSRLPNLRRIE